MDSLLLIDSGLTAFLITPASSLERVLHVDVDWRRGVLPGLRYRPASGVACEGCISIERITYASRHITTARASSGHAEHQMNVTCDPRTVEEDLLPKSLAYTKPSQSLFTYGDHVRDSPGHPSFSNP
ncbi:hypothetical protein Bbelb_190920 [Branchiostoma belcheri]|nr:hypothetical protein Bbelb_190920 [Branchiostoma belcheri]